jgi:hypothetical protein
MEHLTINNCPPHADGSCSPACGLWDMERRQSAASKTEEATSRPESWATTPFRRRIFDRSGVKARTNHAVGHILPCWDVETRVVHIMAQHTLCAKPSERGKKDHRIRSIVRVHHDARQHCKNTITALRVPELSLM